MKVRRLENLICACAFLMLGGAKMPIDPVCKIHLDIPTAAASHN